MRYIYAKLSRTTSPDVTVHLKSMFARHGIPDQLISDNGPQFASNTFAKFAEEYGFTHVTTSPRYPQANGEVERAVQNKNSYPTRSTDTTLVLPGTYQGERYNIEGQAEEEF